MTDKENKWIKFYPSLELPKERVSIAYDTHDKRGYRFAYGYFQFYNGTCGCFWKDGNEQPKVVKAEDIKYWMPVPSLDVQEEPVSEQKLSNVGRIGKNCKEPASEIDFEQELYKAFGQVKDFTLGMRIAKRFYEIGRNHKEPISEDLEEAAREYAGIPKDSPHDLKYCVHDKKAKYNAVLYGANWQKQQMERYRIEHCKSLTNEQAELEENFVSSHVEKNNRIPTFIDAIEYGMRLQNEQMMAKAVDVTIAIPYQNGYGGYTQLLDSKEGLPFGDKLKVLVIKED